MAGRRKIDPDLSQPVVGRFFHLEILWQGDYPGVRFASEGAARWFIRNNRDALVRGFALALDSGRWLVNPDRFVQIREELARARAEKRISAAAA